MRSDAVLSLEIASALLHRLSCLFIPYFPKLCLHQGLEVLTGSGTARERSTYKATEAGCLWLLFDTIYFHQGRTEEVTFR